MAGFNNFYNPNQSILNQLMRQKENVENLINQYNQPQAPVQNIINTGTSLEFEARILKDDEEVDNIFINKRTMFLDKKNKKLLIKEVDGKISEEYEILIPLDEKDKQILDLEKRLKEMEEKINEHKQPFVTDNKQSKSNGYDNEYNDTTAKTNGTSVFKKTK